MVVFKSFWPSSSKIISISWTHYSKCVANEWRKVAAGLFDHPGYGYGSLHRLPHIARFEVMTALGTGIPFAPTFLLGVPHCHAHSRLASGTFLARA